MKKNIIANIIGRFWGILSNFLFIPLYIKYLGFESFSIISFSLIIAGLMAVLDAGLTATLSREFSKSDNSKTEKFAIFKTLESTYQIIVLLTILIVVFSSDYIASNGINLKTFAVDDVAYFIKIIAFDIGFQLLLRFYLGGFLGLEKQVKANAFQVFWGFCRNALVVVAISYTPTLEMFFLWQTISTMLFTILFRVCLYKELIGKYVFDLAFRIEKVVFDKIWRFAGGMLTISLIAALNTQLDKLAISKFLPSESLGYYTLAVSLATAILVIVSPISIALLPRFTSLYSDKKKEEACKLFEKVNLMVVIMVFSLMVNMSFYAKEIIWIWTGKIELAEKASEFLPIVAFTYAMLSIVTIPYNIAIANGYTKLNNLLGILSLIVTLPGYWFATKIYGVQGVAIVFCFVQTMITLIYIYFINKKFLGISFTKLYIGQIILPFSVALIVGYCFTFLLEYVKDYKVFTLCWIGFSTILTVLFSGILLLYKDIHLLKKIMSK